MILCPQLKINPHHQHHLLLLISSIGDGHQTRGRPWLVAFFLSLSKELLLPPIVLLLLRGLPVVKTLLLHRSTYSCTTFPCYLDMEINQCRDPMNNNKDCRVGQLTNRTVDFSTSQLQLNALGYCHVSTVSW